MIRWRGNRQASLPARVTSDPIWPRHFTPWCLGEDLWASGCLEASGVVMEEKPGGDRPRATGPP